MKKKRVMRAGFLALILVMAVSPAGAKDVARSSLWADLTRADIKAIHDEVLAIHPAVRDPQSPNFVANTETAYRNALLHASQARCFLDWRATVNEFIQAFRDGHTFIRFNVQPSRARWPGFLIDGRGGGYVVTAIASPLPGISEGDRLVACDGVPVDALLKDRLDAREADWSKSPERIRQAWRLFVDYDVDSAPPLKQCSFDHKGAAVDVKLMWIDENPLALTERTARLLRRPAKRRPIALSYQEDGSALIRIGSFGYEGELAALEKTMRADAIRLHAAPYVIFDLRGNAGGNSTWGTTYSEILFGIDAVAAIDDPASGKYFRASPEAVERLRLIAKGFKDEGPEMADVASYWTKIADRVAASAAGDKSLFVDFINPPAKGPTVPPVSAYQKPVYVLTDAGCFSSCVVAANLLIKLGGINVGEVMGQNEEYGEITGPLALPSGLARYWLPVSIIRQRREDLGGQPVVEAWPGAMDDDAGLYSWIAQSEAAKRAVR